MAQQGSAKKSGKEPETAPIRRGRSAAVAQDTAQAGMSAFKRKGFADPTLVLHWAEIVGPEVARLAVPVKFSEGAQGGILTLKAEPGASVFLAHETRELCARINAYLGRPAIAKLRFVQGPLASPRPALPPQPRPSVVRDQDPATRFAGAEALREALLSLARWRG